MLSKGEIEMMFEITSLIGALIVEWNVFDGNLIDLFDIMDEKLIICNASVDSLLDKFWREAIETSTIISFTFQAFFIFIIIFVLVSTILGLIAFNTLKMYLL